MKRILPAHFFIVSRAAFLKHAHVFGLMSNDCVRYQALDVGLDRIVTNLSIYSTATVRLIIGDGA